MKNDGKFKGEKFQGPDYLAPYPVSRQAPAMELVDLARQIAAADDLLTIQAAGKLKLLARQMEELREAARSILAETRRNQQLHRARCSFRKIAGRIYHLYRAAGGDLLFSLIGPEEWGPAGSRPYEFIGSYRLEPDQSWTLQERQQDSNHRGRADNRCRALNHDFSGGAEPA